MVKLRIISYMRTQAQSRPAFACLSSCVIQRYFLRYFCVILRHKALEDVISAHLHFEPQKSVHDRDRVNTTREQKGSFRETEKGMNAALTQDIDQLRQMTTAQLQLRYRELFGQASHSNHKDYLFRRVAWRTQAVAEGGLSERARQYAREIAADVEAIASVIRGVLAGSVALVAFGMDSLIEVPSGAAMLWRARRVRSGPGDLRGGRLCC